jgi:hypothetical protein
VHVDRPFEQHLHFPVEDEPDLVPEAEPFAGISWGVGERLRRKEMISVKLKLKEGRKQRTSNTFIMSWMLQEDQKDVSARNDPVVIRGRRNERWL